MTSLQKVVFALLCLSASIGFAEKKPNILVVDSYYSGYQWSDGIGFGLSSRLLLEEVNYETIYIDAKRSRGNQAIRASVDSILSAIPQKEPDLVIACDDIAIKNVLEAHYKNKDLPFVFCGLNWNAAEYGLPYKNTTGIVEINHSASVIDLLSQHAKGARIGLLSIDALSERRSLEHYNKPQNHPIHKAYFVDTMEEWKNAFKKLQSEVDMLFLENPEGVTNWSMAQAKDWVTQTARIPIGSVYTWLAPLSLYTIATSPEEQGWWAAELAMQIISGADPSSLSLVANKEGKLIANLPLANKLGIQFSTAILQTAEIIKP